MRLVTGIPKRELFSSRRKSLLYRVRRQRGCDVVVRRFGVASCGLALAAALVAGGCTPDEPKQSTSPSPAMTASASPTPTENAQERQQRLDREAAENAYRTSDKELARLAMAGGASKPTKILRATTAGDYLAVQMSDLKDLKKRGWRADRPIRSSVVADGGWSATEIGLTACEDTSEVRLLNKDGKEVLKKRPRRMVQSLTATRISGTWKVTDLETRFVKSFANESGCQL